MEEDFSKYLTLVNNCQPGDPLLSSSTLGDRLNQIPLHLLQSSDLIDLTQALNVEQLIPTESGLARDYRGLAELMGFSSIEIETRLKRSYNPTKSLIELFINRNLTNSINDWRNQQQTTFVTVNDLLKIIERIERFDVIDDFLPILIKFASKSSLKQGIAQQSVSIAPESQQLQQATTSSIGNRSHQPANLVKPFDRLTIDDTPQAPETQYDAFICYSPEDLQYAQELISLLEECNKRVATADDLLPGHFEHDALIKLIDVRCRKVIIILTPNFLQSKECEFQTKFASEIGIKAGSPKILPVLYEVCDESHLPPMIRVLSKIDMTNRGNYHWQLSKLIRSLDSSSMNAQNNARPIDQINRAVAWRLKGSHNHQQPSLNGRNDTVLAITNYSSATSVNFSPEQSDQLNGSYEPMVDLLQSQSSTLKTSVAQQAGDEDSQARSNPTMAIPNSGSVKNSWFSNVKRKVLGCDLSSIHSNNSNNSRALLITSASTSPTTEFNEDSMLYNGNKFD